MLADPAGRREAPRAPAPGKLFLVDLEKGRIVEDDEVKRQVATQRPYGQWVDDNVVHFNDLPSKDGARARRAAARRCSWRSATRRRTCAC